MVKQRLTTMRKKHFLLTVGTTDRDLDLDMQFVQTQLLDKIKEWHEEFVNRNSNDRLEFNPSLQKRVDNSQTIIDKVFIDLEEMVG